MADLSSIDKTIQQIKAGQARPVYLCYGDQDFLVKQAYDRICEALVPESLRAFNFEQCDGARVEVAALLDNLQTMPMMPGPKVLGVPECRFLLSKAQGGELLAKSREKWDQGDTQSGLRLLGKVLALADLDWAAAEALSFEDFKAALSAKDADETRLGGEWLAKALAQGKASSFPLPKGGDESQELLAGLETVFKEAPGLHLVLSAPSADGRKKLFKYIESHGQILDFKSSDRGPAAAQASGAFLHHLIAQKGLKMEASLGQRLISSYGHDLGLLAREVEKMEAHAWPNTELKASDLEAVGSPRPEELVFELLAALGRKDLGQSLVLLEEQARNHPVQMIFAMLSKEVRLLYLARCLVEEGKVPAKLDYPSYRATHHPKICADLPGPLAEFWKKTHVYVSFQALSRCKGFKLEELKSGLDFLLQAEIQIKTGGRNPLGLLEECCLRLCGVTEPRVV